MCWWRDSACTPESLWVSVKRGLWEMSSLGQLFFSRLLMVLRDPFRAQQARMGKEKKKRLEMLKKNAPKLPSVISQAGCFFASPPPVDHFPISCIICFCGSFLGFPGLGSLVSSVLIRKQARLFRQFFFFRIRFVKRPKTGMLMSSSRGFWKFCFCNWLLGQTAACRVSHQCCFYI